MCDLHRRHATASLGGLLLSPIALSLTLAACKENTWPEGMAEIKWDRDTCTRCSMVISDRRFAIQLRGGPGDTVFKFDDVGCLIFWLQTKREKFPWLTEAATRMWVADFDSTSREDMHWLSPKQAHYITKISPMGYNFAAVAHPQMGSLDFESMREHVLSKGR